MSAHGSDQAAATQPTCRQRPASTNSGTNPTALEITHAFRLRRKLCGDDGPVKLVINVWGVGYRLIDGDMHRPQPPAAV